MVLSNPAGNPKTFIISMGSASSGMVSSDMSFSFFRPPLYIQMSNESKLKRTTRPFSRENSPRDSRPSLKNLEWRGSFVLGDRGLLPGGERLWLKRSRGGRATSRDLGGEGVRFLSTATVRPNSSTNVPTRQSGLKNKDSQTFARS